MNQQDPEDNFQLTEGFKSYVSKPEITALKPNYLVKGSKNVLVDYANRVVSRRGYTLYHEPAAFDLSRVTFDTTFYGTAFSPGPNDTSTTLAFGGWGDSYYDFLNFVLPGKPQVADTVYLWIYVDTPSVNDAVIQVNRVTSAWVGSGVTLATPPTDDGVNWGSLPAVNAGAGWIRVNITSLYNAWQARTYPNYGIKLNPTVTTNNNAGAFQSFHGANPPYLEIIKADTSSGVKSSFDWDTSTAKSFGLRAWGQTLEFDWNDTWNTLLLGLPTPHMQFAKIWDNTEKIDVLIFVLGQPSYYKWSGAVAKVRDCPTPLTTLRKQGVITDTTLAFTAGTPGSVAGTLSDSNANFVNAGFVAGDTLFVSGSVSNNKNFTIGSVTASFITFIITDIVVNEAAGATTLIHTGEPTWASARFFTNASGTRSINYRGTSYTYTGGEATDTLTGLSAFPTPTLGDPVWNNAILTANPGDIPLPFAQDLVGVQLNSLIFGSTKSLEIYISASPDYTDFALTSPRAPSDPAKINMDNFPTCIVPVDNSDQNVSSLVFGAGTSEFFKLNYQLSQDNATELVRMIKLKSAIGSGLISTAGIGNIKNATAYITREPSLDTLGNIEKADENDLPLSDPIKDDFDAYDFTDAHVKYWKRAIYIALPAEGLILIYDLMRKLWQPPQTMAISRLAIIDDDLYGHSSVVAETYKLFDGTNDNGNFINQVARFAYNNGGRRDRIKNMTEYWTDGYITPNGVLTMNQNIGFNGSVAAKQMTILGSDTDITTPINADPLGSSPLGSDPLGGASSTEDLSDSTTLRFYQVDTMERADYIEQFVEYVMTTLDARFAIVAHGSNQEDVGTAHISHKK